MILQEFYLSVIGMQRFQLSRNSILGIMEDKAIAQLNICTNRTTYWLMFCSNSNRIESLLLGGVVADAINNCTRILLQ